jgi:acyl CoA:acetate/3-ketoacid CoA transferase beta subunit
VETLSLPVTALACVCRVITDLGVFDPAGDHFVCRERAPHVERDTIEAMTGLPYDLRRRLTKPRARSG